MADVIVCANQTYLSEYVCNVLCFNNLVNVNTQLQTFADNFRSAWDTHFSVVNANDWSLDSLTFSFLTANSVDYSVTFGFTAGPLVGQNTADEAIPQGACLVSTQYVGSRPNRGRIYFGGLTESAFASGRVTASTVSAAEDLVNAWRTGISDGIGDCFLRILRRPSSKFPTFVSSPVSTVVGRSRPGTQRKRVPAS